jgi:hypothetical protein
MPSFRILRWTSAASPMEDRIPLLLKDKAPAAKAYASLLPVLDRLGPYVVEEKKT